MDDCAGVRCRPLLAKDAELHAVKIAIRSPVQIGEHCVAGGVVTDCAIRGHHHYFSRAGHEGRAGEEGDVDVAVVVKDHICRHRIGQHFAAVVGAGEDAGDGIEDGYQRDFAGGRVNFEQIVAPCVGHIKHPIGAGLQAVGMGIQNAGMGVVGNFKVPGAGNFCRNAVGTNAEHTAEVVR